MEQLLVLILGMAIVTYLPRFLPLYVLTRMEIPTALIAWLRYIPVAVLAALIVPGITAAGGQISLGWGNSYLLASIIAFLIAWRSKNMMLTLTVGMGVVLLLQWFPLV
ncbi:MAG: hypothetical protein DDT30_00758 [Dehalococcoidia bacterium]|nr:hypothetical protein [Bacillota bacterium]MBT9142267.1 hypothetical protein [Bacillota bacterium]